MTLPNLTLVLGGTASGKSSFAETLIQRSKAPRVYIATAQVFDDEMLAKVARHRDMRGDGWQTIEEPIAVAAKLEQITAGQIVLLDCATLWLTNVILAERDLERESARLISSLVNCAGRVVVVSNEVGQGIVPDNAMARQFRNAQGTFNQSLASKADLVVAVMAGLPLALKGQLP